MTTAGDTLTITCTATVIEGLVVSPSLQWLAPDNSAISTTGNPSLTGEPVVTGVESIVAVRFMPLRTSQGGSYSCMASITIPGFPPVQSMETTQVIVQSESAIVCADQLCVLVLFSHLQFLPLS